MPIIAFLIALVGTLICGPMSANAAEAAREPDLTVAHVQDLLSAKRHRRHYAYRYYGYRHYGFAPGDPSWQAPIARQGRQMGRCVFDEGYGRFRFCN
jgi:hypothetical protein